MAHPTPVRRRLSVGRIQQKQVLVIPESIRALASSLSEALSPFRREVYIFLFPPSAGDNDVSFRIFRGDKPGALPHLTVPGTLQCHTHLQPGPDQTPFTPPSDRDLMGSIWDNLIDDDFSRYTVVFQPNGGMWWWRPQQQLLNELLKLQPDLIDQVAALRSERLTPPQYVARAGEGVYDFNFTPPMLERVVGLENTLNDLQIGLRTGAAFFIEEDSETGEEHEIANKARTLPEYLAEANKAGFEVHYAGPDQQAAVPLSDRQMALAIEVGAADRGALTTNKLATNPSLLPYLVDRLSDPDTISEPDYL